ncbi:hypothetical protein CGMCC3_g2226 [Colletotrichum fructicola]|nr:uncharacterized protein CGMCC3_g2226 [Colletotrichum fructicola]KAE9581770.1 hypothetical protein CGMCC3_g2226 [Colletotrichum fructicola]
MKLLLPSVQNKPGNNRAARFLIGQSLWRTTTSGTALSRLDFCTLGGLAVLERLHDTGTVPVITSSRP